MAPQYYIETNDAGKFRIVPEINVAWTHTLIELTNKQFDTLEDAEKALADYVHHHASWRRVER